jgi:hypothetical protein
MVPPTIQGTFKGNGDYSNGGNQYIQFQVADNECFMDNKCLYMICDLLVYGPNNTELNSDGTTYGNPIDLYFDQSSDALFSQLTIGSPQGLKMEEIQQYNMWANIIRLHTESAAHKEHDLLRYTEYEKEKGKSYGLQHLTDDLWRTPVRIPIGIKTRVAMRFDFSDFMQNMELFPLFLMRNGLQITIYLENVYKAMYSPSGFSTAKDIIFDSGYFPNQYIIGQGRRIPDGTGLAPTISADVDNANAAVGIYFSPYYQLTSNFTGTGVAIQSTQSLWLRYGLARGVLDACGSQIRSAERNRFIALPVSIKEFNQIVWSGFALVPNTSLNFSVGAVVLDGFLDGDGDLVAHHGSALTITSAPYATNSLAQTAISNARQNVKQLDVDGSQPPVARNLTVVRYTRYGSNTGLALTNGSLREFYLNWHLFSFNDTQQIPFAKLANENDVIACNLQHSNSGGQIIFHCADAIFLDTANNLTANGSSTTSVLPINDPAVVNTVFTIQNPGRNAFASVLSQWGLTEQQRKFRYEITNPQLLMNLIKPSAEVAMRWQQEFTSPSGIAVKYKKVIYQKKSFNEQSTGLLQVTLPISVRSLTGLIFVIQDPALDAVPNNVINNMLLANLSTFQNRRLTEQYIQVGGQQYPVYMYQMRPDGDNTQYWESHVLELEKLFAVAGTASFNSCLSRPMIKKTRNMLAGGYLGATNPIQTGNLSAVQRCTYTDASGIVYGMNLAKDWMRTFTCGIDSSAVGNISLNLYFKDPSNSSNVSTAFGPSSNATNQSGARAFSLHMFAICDAVLTLQESANMVRY